MVLLALLSVVAACTPTPVDGFGPFGRGMPPVRSKIGTGHVLTGIVVSPSCRPLAHARVELMQSDRDGVYRRRGSATVFTDPNGRFRFEGPVPAQYEALPPHIHLRVVAKNYLTLLTRYVVPTGEKVGHVVLVLRLAPL